MTATAPDPAGLRLARRALEAGASATVRLADEVAARRRRGEAVLDFTAGRPAEATPGYICDAAERALRAGDTHQTPARGTPELLAACAAKLQRDNGIDADPARTLLATLGAKHGLVLALLAILDPGDEVLIEDPCFVSYAPAIRMCEGIARAVPLRREDDFRWTRDALDAAVTPRTRAILLCAPHNPIGVVPSSDDLAAIADVAVRRDLLVIADETYERLTWGGRGHVSIATLPEMAARTVTLMGLTKAFAMGGWRVGFAHAPAALVDAMLRFQQHMNTCVGSFAQAGAAAALAEPASPELRELWRDWERRCAFAAESLDALPGVACPMPEGGFYAWIDVRERSDRSEALCAGLLRDHGVALVPGRAFGPSGEGFVRMTAVRPWDELREGVGRLQRALG